MKSYISKFIFLIVVPFVLSACSTTSERPEKFDTVTGSDVVTAEEATIVGRWTGRVFKEKHDYVLEWDWQARPDKTYTIKLTTVQKDGSARDTTEEGIWWVEDGRFYELNPKLMRSPDVYEILFLNEKYFIYRSISYDSSTINPSIGSLYINVRK